MRSILTKFDQLPSNDGLYNNHGTVLFRIPPHPRLEARSKVALSGRDIDHVPQVIE